MAIISINGRIGSGKDTIAKLIQRQEFVSLAESGKISPQSVPNLHQIDTHSFSGSRWENKKFAEKLKQMLSMLTGIRREKFEDQDFKANYVINLLDFSIQHKSRVDFYYDQDMKDAVIECINNQNHNIYITIRLLLQLFGTDIIRHWMPLAWVNSVFVDYELEEESDPNSFPYWLITDLRFPNEFEGTKKNGGFTVRVNRGEWLPNDASKHISETALDNHYVEGKFDWVIDNNGSLEELEQKVIEMLNHFKLS